MADGEITLKLEPKTADRLRAGAEALGVTVEDLAAELLEQHFFDYDDYDWGDDDPRARRDELAEDGPTYPLEEVLAEFGEALEKRLTSKS